MNENVKIIEPMNADEARKCVQKIRDHVVEIGHLVRDLREREGWKALGYKSFTDCLNHEFNYSRKHLYEMMKAAPIIDALLPTGNRLSSGQAAIVAHYPQELQTAIVSMTQTRYGNITESNL